MYYCTNEELCGYLEDNYDLVELVIKKRGKQRNGDRWEFIPHEEAENLCLEALAHAIAMYDQARVDVKPSSYYYRAMENALKMFWRGKRAQKEIARKENESSIEDLVETSGFDDGWTENIALKLSIKKSLDVLEEEERKVFLLTFNRSQEEVGRMIGKSQSKVSIIYRSAISKLQAALEEAG